MTQPRETFAYFPGCLTTESAREYDLSIRWLAREIGIDPKMIKDWNCCGAGIVQDIDPAGGRALAARNLALTSIRPVVSGCPVCVEKLQEASTKDAALHALNLFARADIRERLAFKIRSTGEARPVGSLKVAVFYGCETPAADAPLESLMELAGATVMKWGGLRRCCGGYLLCAKPELGFDMLEKVFKDFEKSEADAIVTACPHCHFNLDAFQFPLGRRRRSALEVPVLHFTEVLALAMNADAGEKWLEKHLTSAFPLLERLVTEEEKRKAAEAKARKNKDKP